MNEYVTMIQEGKIVGLEHEIKTGCLKWNPHPKCQGVALKHLITAEVTSGKLSCHLVRVNAGCEISEHIHEGNMELHEILIGQGTGVLAEKEIPYVAGTSVVIPENQPHKVLAGEEDLYLLAKFIPALV